jgi:hypothetical protein
MSEALYVGVCVQPVLRDRLRPASPVEPRLTFRAFLAFYVPLAMTSLLVLLVQPVGSAALSRMPQPLESLAVWPVISGLVFMLRSLGIAYNEVVVALLDEPRSTLNLSRFAAGLAGLTTLLLVFVAATPLADFWFSRVSALSPPLAALAGGGLWLAILLPPLNAMQSWYQGAIMHQRRTRGITESVVIFLVSNGGMLWAGVVWARLPGLYVGLAALGLGNLAQTAWLWYRSRPVMRDLRARDAAGLLLQPAPHQTFPEVIELPGR